MNTKQKLTIGIAAIFMVTLTIVGVTYAYFVTRVTGDNSTVDVSTATLGDVVYVPGNDGKNGSDVITIEEVLPGQGTVYKKFAVQNQNSNADGIGYFKVITTNSHVGKTEFIHTADGLNSGSGAASDTDVLYTCYGYNGNKVLDATVVQPKMSNEEGASELCFADNGIYNNIKITLWEVSESVYNGSVISDPAGEVKSIVSRLSYNKTDVITDRLDIAGGDTNGEAEGGYTTKYYVLKVEYEDAGYNQNAENLAGLDILVSIQAA